MSEIESIPVDAAASFRERLDRNHAGEATGVTSVCSAHPLVLEAAALQAKEDGSLLLVEATSNQVDQYGGYTGMLPAEFVDLVQRIVAEVELSRSQLVLGGDHLGPNRWRDLGATEAMSRAEVLIAAYVQAGFTKLHLDCSMACAGDPTPLPGEVVAERAARLARAAVAAAKPLGRESELSYVIGTEVPVPGGAQETIDTLVPTEPDDARETLATHREAFTRLGVESAWDQVVALVVQPGVEFDHLRVVDFDAAAAQPLSAVVADYPELVFEAHSTDYQTREALAGMVRGHWAILKVGPGLTFALREALFALAAIEDELIPAGDRSDLVEGLEKTMTADPSWWRGYYDGDAEQQRLARRYSYSDRARYYWPEPGLADRVDRLLRNLDTVGIPLPLLSQHLPTQYRRIREGVLRDSAQAVVVDRVRDVLRDYAYACGDEGETA